MTIQGRYFGSDFEKKIHSVPYHETGKIKEFYGDEFSAMTKDTVEYTLGPVVDDNREKALMESWDNMYESLGHNIMHYRSSSCGDSKNRRLFEHIRMGEKELKEALEAHHEHPASNDREYAITLRETADTLEAFGDVRSGIWSITSFEKR